ncbi:LysM peptidoglycan-binding domain-containing protein [Listeria seeligeri]|uniref:LysM peptidoglycan-binding domain-containing protein n=1 Tax=Listeria seeligeri TaxID=1640 RepID=UPI001625F600|nr:LysM peptidoglycan-binding domain-containing protein [Listeria seeligeri]MBC1722234.1 LysM peptidoglycan-binding domain-containing protein [Listeria seeligeri]MBF2435761.1 LysM peptidoglycan-binding domain-containing protein [Listeria seeligeri]
MSEQKNKKAIKSEAPAELKQNVLETKAYVVREDDKLSKIATAHGLSVGELAEKNKLDSYKLKVGQELNL